MRQTLLPAVIVSVLLGCSSAPFSLAESGGDLVIRSGTSFGMCMGYCNTELSVDEDEIVFTETSRDPQRFPTRSRRMRTDPAEWRELASRAQPEALAGVERTYGCPDCADGGAEWVEVQWGDQRQRVTFEYGSSVPHIGPLVERIRAIRERIR